MNHRLWINLLLLLLVAVLGLLAWLQPGKQAEPELETLTARSPDSVRSLVIEPAGGQILRFERQQGQWQMLEPYRMPANGARLDALARVLEAPILSQFPLPEERLAEFGLDRPLLLRLDQQSFAFGGNEPINHHRYVRFEDRLALIVDRFQHHLAASAEQLLSPALLPEGAKVQSVEAPNYQLSLGDSGWQLQPQQVGLGADDLAGHAIRWGSAQGLSVRQFEQPGAEQRVRVRLATGALFEFLIVERDSATWLVRTDNGIGYQVPNDSDLLQPPHAKQPSNDDA